MFLFKKIASQFFFPLPLCLIVSFTGLALLWLSSSTRRQKAGKILVTIGLSVLTLFSYGFVSDALLRPLESAYPVFDPSPTSDNRQPTTDNRPPIRYVVVLGGGVSPDPRLPASSRLDDATLKRLAEGIRIHGSVPNSKLILAGGNWLDTISEARVMCEMAELIGVKQDEIIVEEQSKDTRDQAKLLKPVVGTNRFVLVTSASHMPRAMALFKHERLDPIAAPAEHAVRAAKLGPGSFFPAPGCLENAHRAAYEFMALAWQRLRGEL